MLQSLLAIHFVLTIVIIGLILLQKHDSDGALGSSGGGAASGMFSVRGQANLLTRATAVLMTVFIINCLAMAKIAKNTAKRESIIDSAAKKVAMQQTEEMTEAPNNSSRIPNNGTNEQNMPASNIPLKNQTEVPAAPMPHQQQVPAPQPVAPNPQQQF